jgi:hypothetical protein
VVEPPCITASIQFAEAAMLAMLWLSLHWHSSDCGEPGL